MDKKAIIFDLDGTIIDTNWIWKKVTIDLITSRGITIDEQRAQELEQELSGLELSAACTYLKKETGIIDSVQSLVAEKKRRACEIYETQLGFIPGFETFHKKVSHLGLKSGIATNSDAASLNQVKTQLHLDHFFGNHIYSIADVNFVYKPDPAVYLHAAQQLGVAPENCVAIEDSKHGVTAAKKAGMYCIGINTAQTPELISHADIVINSYSEINLKDIIKREPK